MYLKVDIATAKCSTLASYFNVKDRYVPTSVTRKKSPNVYKSCLKVILLEKWMILTPLQNLPKNVGDLGKSIVAKGFKKTPKVQ